MICRLNLVYLFHEILVYWYVDRITEKLFVPKTEFKNFVSSQQLFGLMNQEFLDISDPIIVCPIDI